MSIQTIIRENWETEADRLKIGKKEKERMRPAFEEVYREIDIDKNSKQQ